MADTLRRTLGRKSKKTEDQLASLENESKKALSNSITNTQFDPNEYKLDEGQSKEYIDPKSLTTPEVVALQKKLLDWLNDKIMVNRIIVRDLIEDLADGFVLSHLMCSLTKNTDYPESTQNPTLQKKRLEDFVIAARNYLGSPEDEIWSAEAIYDKDAGAILKLLVSLARQDDPKTGLPHGVHVNKIIITKTLGVLKMDVQRLIITEDVQRVMTDDQDMVIAKLKTFVNSHLAKLNVEIIDLTAEFSSGVYLIQLLGLVGGFFVPLYNYSQDPETEDAKQKNAELAFRLMEQLGIPKLSEKPSDLIAQPRITVKNILYRIYSFYGDQ